MAQNQQIMCSVNNCHYWAKGNRCDANQIFITSDELVRQSPDRFDAPQAQNALPTPVKTCMETACKTFVHQGSPKTNTDGVVKM
ncbi:MAG: DUF1540 domain-containing protein [Bacillota bacterium]